MSLNAKFNSWKEFSVVLGEYSKATYQTFVKDDSKMVESVNFPVGTIFSTILTLLTSNV